MLTEHRPDNEGKKPPRNSKSRELWSFIEGCKSISLRHWETYLARYVNSYCTIEPVDKIYFCDATRTDYWDKFKRLLDLEKTLVFVDPDTGLETGSPAYLTKRGREKYILIDEFKGLINTIQSTSVLMIYQHLPPDRRYQERAVDRKLKQVAVAYSNAFVCGYREEDLSFIFVSKIKEVHMKIINVLKKYDIRSTNTSKSFHEKLPDSHS